jgi:hypothetical protein
MSALFPTAVYALCFLTSVACSILLGRSYARTRARLLLWSALCFGFLALNNFLVVIDLVVLPTEVDLRLYRYGFAIAGILTLLYGFIVDQED